MTAPDGDFLTDEQVREAVSGSVAAREGLLRVIARRVPAMVNVRLSPSMAQHHVVEDLAQEVMISIADGLSSMREPTVVALKSFTSVIAARRVADFVRVSKSGNNTSPAHSLESGMHAGATSLILRDLIPASSLTPRSAAVRAEGIRHTMAELSNLKDEYRDVITLAFFDQLPMAEVAERLSLSRGAASMLLMRALKALREGMGRLAAGD